MWWALDADQSTLTLQKAPSIWDSLGEIGDYLRDAIHDVIRNSGAVWNNYDTVDGPQASETVRDVLEAEMTQPGGWSLGTVAEGLQDALDVSQDDALDIARNETASVLNVARADAYEEYAREMGQDVDEFTFKHIGPDNFQTTDQCEEVKAEIESRGGAVTMSEYKEILLEKAKKYADDGGTPERVDSELHGHYNCYHTFHE